MKKIKLKKIKFRRFSSERKMQEMIGDNLNEIFDLDFLRFEFGFGRSSNSSQRRIDILAFDRKLKSFVIIECKNRKTSDVIVQGQSYFNLMKNHAMRFYGEYQEKTANPIQASAIEEKKSRLILISTGYTERQKDAVDDDSRVELWEVKAYENNTVSFNRVDKSAPKDGSQYVVFDMKKDAHPIEPPIDIGKNSSDKTMEDLYKEFKNGILGINKAIKPNVRTTYRGFDTHANIVGIKVYARQLKMWINMPKKTLKDPKKLTEDVSGIGHLGNGDYQIKIKSNENLKYILGLVKQSLKYHGNKKKALSIAEKYHFGKGSTGTVKLYKKFKPGILALGDIEIKSNKRAIHFVANATNDSIAMIVIQKTQLKLRINMPKGELKKDRKEIMTDTSESKSLPLTDYATIITSDKDRKYILGLVKQSLKFKGTRRRKKQ